MMDHLSRRQFLKNVPALAMGAFPILLVPPATERPKPSVQFTDITDAAGITFQHISAPEKKYIVESMSGGVALSWRSRSINASESAIDIAA